MRISYIAFRTEHTGETYRFYTKVLELQEHFRLYN